MNPPPQLIPQHRWFARPSLRSLVIGALTGSGIWLLALGPVFATGKFRFTLKNPDWIEAIVLWFGLMAILSSASLRATLWNQGTACKWLLVLLTVMILHGQFARNSSASFPFVSWGMYTNPRPTPKYASWTVTYRDGSVGEFPFQKVSNRGGIRPFLERFQKLVLRPEADPNEVERLHRGLVALFNHRHSDNPIVEMQLLRRTIPIDSFSGRESISGEVVAVFTFRD